MQQGQSEDATGTRDETYDVISIVYHALQGAENCEIYAEDAEGDELRQFFERAGQQQRQLAEEGKRMLAKCLQNEGGGSAFSFGEGQAGQSSSSQSETVTSGGGQTGGGIG
jgi:hypothetical protein